MKLFVIGVMVLVGVEVLAGCSSKTPTETIPEAATKGTVPVAWCGPSLPTHCPAGIGPRVSMVSLTMLHLPMPSQCRDDATESDAAIVAAAIYGGSAGDYGMTYRQTLSEPGGGFVCGFTMVAANGVQCGFLVGFAAADSAPESIAAADARLSQVSPCRPFLHIFPKGKLLSPGPNIPAGLDESACARFLVAGLQLHTDGKLGCTNSTRAMPVNKR